MMVSVPSFALIIHFGQPLFYLERNFEGRVDRYKKNVGTFVKNVPFIVIIQFLTIVRKI